MADDNVLEQIQKKLREEFAHGRRLPNNLKQQSLEATRLEQKGRYGGGSVPVIHIPVRPRQLALYRKLP